MSLVDELSEFAERGDAQSSGDANDPLRLAAALGTQNRWQEAAQVLRRVLEADAENLPVAVNLAHALIQCEWLEEAAEAYQHVLGRRPDYYQVHSSLAFVRERQGRLDEALAAVERAIVLAPDYPEAFNNLGVVRRAMHRLDDACEAFQRALELRPNFALAEFNLATTLLLAENYAAGWSGYRQYARLEETPVFESGLPEWDGRPIPGKRLLVYVDQGFGDAIQFARFLAGCKARSQAHVVLCCQSPLVRLFAGRAGADELVQKEAINPPCHCQISLASLPGLFGVTLDSVAATVPYLRPVGDLRSEIADRLRVAAEGSLRVGLVWQGNPKQKRDVVRSCPLFKLRPLLECEGATFFSLQTGKPGRRQIGELQLGKALIDVGAMLIDFADTASVLTGLDLIVTVDTATAHLAGALGRPVWTLLCHTPDWRWHLSRSDSPWYPTMRLFRQPRWGDWDSVVKQVADALKSRPPFP